MNIHWGWAAMLFGLGLFLGQIPGWVRCQRYAWYFRLYRLALGRISQECGAVCDEFEVCKHPACDSSSNAKITAGDALKGFYFGRPGERTMMNGPELPEDELW